MDGGRKKTDWQVRAEARETEARVLRSDLDQTAAKLREAEEQLRKTKTAPAALSDVELAALTASVAAHTVIAQANMQLAYPYGMMSMGAFTFAPGRSGGFTHDGQAARDRLYVELVRRGVIKSDVID